jgi:tetratricopeptide (TPR) repeat protein
MWSPSFKTLLLTGLACLLFSQTAMAQTPVQELAPAQPEMTEGPKLTPEEISTLQQLFDDSKRHFTAGVALRQSEPTNFQGAIQEFEQAILADPVRHEALREVYVKANVQLADVQYLYGVDYFNRKEKAEAKPHFDQAIEAAYRAIFEKSKVQEEDHTELLKYYQLLVKYAEILTQYYHEAQRVDPFIQTLNQAIAIDPAHTAQWQVSQANLLRFGDRHSEAIALYKQVLVTDPHNLDALYGLGLSQLSNAPEDINEGINTLQQFVKMAPVTDKRVETVKAAVEAWENPAP